FDRAHEVAARREPLLARRRDPRLEVTTHERRDDGGGRPLDVGLDDGARRSGGEGERPRGLEAARVGEVLGGEAEVLDRLLTLERAREVARRGARAARQ